MVDISPLLAKTPTYLKTNSPYKPHFYHIEELKELIEKSKDYLKNNNNINCFYLLNRISKSILDCELVDIHILFQFYRNYLECMNRILYRTLNKDPEKNDKQMMKIKNLIMKVFNALEEWSDYIVLYLKEYKKTHITKQNERLLKEIIDNISPILLNERDLFNIKVLDIKNEDINEIESPELKKNEKIVKIEEGVTVLSVLKGSKKREASQGKYRDLSYEEKIPFIKFDFYFNEFIYHYFDFCLAFAIWQKKKKNNPLAIYVLLKASEAIKNTNDFNDHKILAIYIKTQMTLATIYWENGFLIETLNIYDKLNEYFRKLLISLHNKGLQCRKKNLLTRFKKKLQGYIRKMSLNFIYQSIIYETIDKYEKSLECLKFSAWLASSFFNPIDEIYIISTGFLSENRNKYDGILKEIGEISNIVQLYLNRAHPPPSFVFLDINESITTNPIVEESNTILYNKFKQKAEIPDYIYVKSFSEQQNTSELTNLTYNNVNLSKINKSLLKPYHPIEKTDKTEDHIKLFEVSLEPSCREQSHSSKRLSILSRRSKIDNFPLDLSKEFIINRDKKAKSFYSERQEVSISIQKQIPLKKILKKKEETHNNSTILTTMKYFKTSEEIRRLIEEKHKKNSFKEIDKTPIPIMHDLDGFFEKKINGILLSKCKNRSIIDVQKTFIELQKDEDFDKKEFDFSKKMLRHKKSYSMGKIISKFLINMKEKDGLGYSRPRGELRNEIKEISTQNRIKSKVDKTKTDKEDEKTINFSLQLCRRSSIMPFDPNEETFGQIPMKDSIIRLNSREKLQNTLIKNKVTFGSKEIADKQGIKDKRRETRSMSIYRRFKNDENKDEDYHKHTKEMIQKMAENIVKDLEKCDKNIEELKINKDFAEKQKKRKEKEINAKKGRITKMNGELSRSVKNFSMKREILENSQNQVLFSVGLKKMVKKKTNIMQPVSLMKLQ